METITTTKVAVYVDGCNLYHGMHTARLRQCYWLDLARLGESFLKENQIIVRTVYFTARVKGNAEKSRRHAHYIDALNRRGIVEVIEGNYQHEPTFCGNCGRHRLVPKEKQTDTNIATELVADAFLDVWDTAFLVSGDSDFVPPIKRIKNLFPQKRIIVVFPPTRTSDDLKRSAHATFHLNESKLKSCQLPDRIEIEGITFSRPEYWKSSR